MKINQKHIFETIINNDVFKNAFNLMLATGGSAVFGFIFWIIVARSYSTESIGIATTILSMTTILSLLGLAGFDSVFMRFLSKSKHKNDLINNGLLISGIVTILLAITFAATSKFISPTISDYLISPNGFILFILVSLAMTWTNLLNSVLIAFRRTSFSLWTTMFVNIIKIGLPFLIASKGPLIIVAIACSVQVLYVLVLLIVLRFKIDFVFSAKINFLALKENAKYGTANYLANVLNLVPDSALPIIVVNKLGPSSAAYFYVAFSIANLLYTIIFATNQVLLSQASHDEKHYMYHAKRGLAIVFAVLTPAILAVIFLAPYVLMLFGKEYSTESLELLRIFAISAYAVMFYSLLNFIFKYTQYLKGMLIMMAVNAIGIIGLCYLLIDKYALVGVGVAWLAGSVLAVLAGLLSLAFSKTYGSILMRTRLKTS